MPEGTAQLRCQPGGEFRADPQPLVLRLKKERIEDQNHLPEAIAVEKTCAISTTKAGIAEKPRRGAVRSLGCTADRCRLAGSSKTDLDHFATPGIGATT